MRENTLDDFDNFDYFDVASNYGCDCDICAYANPADGFARGRPIHVQTLLFETDKFTVAEARRWARNNGFVYSKIHTTERYHRIRQAPPDLFRKSTFRTIHLGSDDTGILAIVAQVR